MNLAALCEQGAAQEAKNSFQGSNLGVNGENLFFFFWNILDMQRQKGSLHLAELFCRQNQGATVRGSDPMCGHSALLCSVATAHALNRGQTSHNACDTLLWRLWEWRNKVWVNQFSSQSLIRGAAQNTHPEGSGITCRLRHSSITVL